MRERWTLIAFAWLVAATIVSGLTRSRASSPDTESDLLPEDDPPIPTTFFFELQPADAGVRRLVLRDEADLVLPLGDVQPFWVCDTDTNYDSKGRYGMRVECGGDALGATAYYSGYLGPEHAAAGTSELEVRAHGVQPVQYTVPVPPQTQLTFITKLPDPQTDCDPSGPTDVDVDVGPVEHFGGHGVKMWFEQAYLRSKVYAIDTMVGGAPFYSCQSDWELLAKGRVRYRCPCPEDLSDHVLDVLTSDGAFIWRDESAATCAGHARIHGGWRLACGAKIHWPWEHFDGRMFRKMEDVALDVAKHV